MAARPCAEPGAPRRRRLAAWLAAGLLDGPAPAEPSPTELTELSEDACTEGLAGGLLAGLEAAHPTAAAAQLAPLRAAHRATLARNLLLLREAGRLARALDTAGVPAVFLKGTALLEQVYRDAGLRAMRDVDVLVPGERADAARATARSLGWRWLHPRRAATRRRHCKQNLILPLGGHRLRLELHAHVDGLGHRGPRTSALLGRARGATIDGAPARIPCPADLALHLAVHWSTEGLLRPLRETLDLACLLRRDGLGVGELRAAAPPARSRRAVEALLGAAAADGLLEAAAEDGLVERPALGPGGALFAWRGLVEAVRRLPGPLRATLALAAADGPADGAGLLVAVARRRVADAWAALHEGQLGGGSTPGIASRSSSRSTE